ncbi:hypothetical protein [Frankia sp. ACN1ag]|uniref:hypothetical protein n=1 Tax=Frankia sp. ACN1ag TaxID=102891 RepID=UPI0037C08119
MSRLARAASNAAISRAPSSGERTALTRSVPSSSYCHASRGADRRVRSCPRACRAHRTSRSICPAVQYRAWVNHTRSDSSSAIRVTARTFAYDRVPAANAARIAGRRSNACPVATCSRAVRRPIPHRHDSQCAHEAIPIPDQPSRRSNAATASSQAHVAAAIRPAHR